MSLQHSPGIVTNGLSFYYDMYNTEKSWKGEPVTNQFICPNPYDSNNNVSFNVNGTGTFQRVYSGTYGGYTIKPTDVVYRYNLGGNGCHYHGNSAAIASGQYVCYSVDYYISPDASDYPTDSTLVVLENYGGSALGGGTGAGGNGIMGKWQTIRGYSGPTSGSGTQAMFLYPGGCGNAYMASRGFILMKNPMFEFRGDVRYNPFVNGTRSNTQAIRDLVGGNTITATSLTYNNDGTFKFDGVDDYIDSVISSGLTGTGAWTMEVWFKVNGAPSNATYGNVIVDTDATGGSANMIVVDYGGGHGGSQNQILYATRPSTGGGYTLLGGSTITQGIYYHAAVVRNGSTDTKLYINGSLNNTYSGNMPTATQPLVRIGRWTDGTVYSNTTIPTVKIYNRPLSANEVAQNFAAQRGIYGL